MLEFPRAFVVMRCVNNANRGTLSARGWRRGMAARYRTVVAIDRGDATGSYHIIRNVLHFGGHRSKTWGPILAAEKILSETKTKHRDNIVCCQNFPSHSPTQQRGNSRHSSAKCIGIGLRSGCGGEKQDETRRDQPDRNIAFPLSCRNFFSPHRRLLGELRVDSRSSYRVSICRM